MKRFRLFQFILFLCVMGISFNSVQAQENELSTTQEQEYPESLHAFYIGARGGYLFKNKELSNNPAYYLEDGYFGELNLGWRAKNSWLGWQLNVGRLDLNRSTPFKNLSDYSLNAYEALQSSSPNWMWEATEDDGETFLFDENTIDETEETDMHSWYAMTGPEFWVGKKRLQGFVSLNAGVGYSQFGHYFIEGKGKTSNSLSFPYYSQVDDEVTGPVDVSLAGMYQQYGMSEDTYTSSGSPSNFTPGSVTDKYEVNFMGRGTLGAEYFITPRLSVNASASFWYILSPKWASQKTSKGELIFKGEFDNSYKPSGGDPYIGGGAISGVTGYDYEKDYPEKDMQMISANIGLRYWLGKKKPKKHEEEDEEPELEEEVTHNKSLLITVKDEPTGYDLSSVKVTVYKDGEEFYTGLTDTDGALSEVEDLEPGDYEVKGILNNIETDIAEISSEDFEGDSRTITRKLMHKDLRFTLVGHTLETDSDAPVTQAKATLNNESTGDDDYQTTNSEGEFKFQLEPDTDFSVYAEKKGFFSNREEVTTKGLDRSKTLYVDLHLEMNALTEGTRFELKDIYYDFDKSDIRSDAAMILDDLYKTMVDNPSLVIELSSHTDSRGSDSYNLKLSQERADAAVHYLVDKGIDASRLQGRGYGETKLINRCSNEVECSEEEHQENRRTEIKILKE